MVKVPRFSGPVTAIDITRWLERCDHLFNESEPALTEHQKIDRAGSAIVETGDTADLYGWFWGIVSELEKISWEEFQDDLMDQALGTKWRTDALRAFFTAANNTRTLEEFSKVLAESSSILNRGKKPPAPIDESILKYQLLFNGAPSRTERVLTNDAYNDRKLVQSSTREVKEWLGKYGDQGPSPSALALADSGMYIFSGLSGAIRGASLMDNLDLLPNKSNLLGRLSTISVGQTNNVSGTLRLVGFKLNFADPELSIDYNIDSYNVYNGPRSLGFGEYITSVKVYYGNISYYQSSASLQTITAVLGIELFFSGDSEPLTRGATSDANPAVFNAPSGWRIVGFHGRYQTSYSSNYNQNFAYYTQMGVIFAPV